MDRSGHQGLLLKNKSSSPYDEDAFNEAKSLLEQFEQGTKDALDTAAIISQLSIKDQAAYWAMDAKKREERHREEKKLKDRVYQAELKQELDKIQELIDYADSLNNEAEKKKFEKYKKQTEREIKYRQKAQEKADEAEYKKKQKDNLKNTFKSNAGIRQRLTETKSYLKSLTRDATGKEAENNGAAVVSLVDNAFKGLSNVIQKMDKDIQDAARKQSVIDTRMQGSKHSTAWNPLGKSYWGDISSTIIGATGVSPLVKQSDVVGNVESMVKQGIAFNIEQRATIQALRDKIADTFNATNSTLLRLVRIQQQDTTAARLGMESALTSFLNNMYETTEYMGSIADGIKGSLEEAMSIMSGENALSFEYQVQKWMGSMYSVGMKQSSVNNIAGVLGQIAAGQLEGITGGNASTLALMAANRAGLSIQDLMMDGMSDSETNRLMQSMVDYLADIYNETKGNNVLQQQYAQIYGLTASDLKSISNLSSSVRDVAKYGLTYNDAMSQLNKMANSMWSRTSMSEMLQNALANAKYSMAAGIGSNPAAYMVYEMANMLDGLVGGINLPDISVMGSGVSLNTTVADLMRVGSLAGGIGTAIAKMVSSGGNGGLTGKGILDAVGVNKGMATVSRGTGMGAVSFSGASVSESGSFAANASTSDVTNATMTAQADENKKTTAEAVNESDEVKLATVNDNITNMYDFFEHTFNELFDSGNRSIRVTLSGSGDLTNPIYVKSTSWS